LAFTGVVIGVAVNDLGGKAGHAQNPPLRAAGTAGQLDIIRSYERKVKWAKWSARTISDGKNRGKMALRRRLGATGDQIR
jgi:hypothetical protein